MEQWHMPVGKQAQAGTLTSLSGTSSVSKNATYEFIGV